jgi:hypothetical protein
MLSPYSIFDVFVSCSVHITKPTCAQSFDLHPLQNGIPSTIFTITSFCKILSCNTTLLPSVKSFNTIGIRGDFLSSAFSHKPKVVTPSSRVLFLMPNDAFLVFPILLFSSSDMLALSSLVDYSTPYCLLNMGEDVLAYIIIEPNN